MSKRLIFIISILLFNYLAMSQTERNDGYEIISWNDALIKLSKNDIFFLNPTKTIRVEDSVNVFLYKLGNKTVVLPEYPVTLFSKNEYPAFIFNNSNFIDQVTSNYKFPIPSKFFTILDKEKETLRQIDRNYSIYIKYFDSVMNTHFSTQIRSEELIKIHPLLKKKIKDTDFDKLILAYSVIVSKYINQEKKSDFFLLQKNQGYSPYYIPCVRLNGSILSPYENLGADELSSSFKKYYLKILLNANPPLPEITKMDTIAYIKYLNEFEN